MEIMKERPAEGSECPSRHDELLVAEGAPDPLMCAAMALRHADQRHFPMLVRVGVQSDAYVGEHLWLDAREAAELLEETRRLRRLGRREEFIQGLHGDRVWDFWRGHHASDAFDAWLDRVEHLLEMAGQHGYWVHLML